VATLGYEFGPFRLDPVERFLLHDGAEVRLTPKVFDLLLVLVGRSGRVVKKDELMRSVWPQQYVEEANLTQSIVMLRKALGDTARAPRYIETRSRRGYRFIADVRELPGSDATPPPHQTVGRDLERAALQREFAAVAGGGARLVCVTGEAGIGKTTLVESFLAEVIAEGRRVTVARGRCSQRLASTGAYLPWLDALEDLVRGPGETIASEIGRLAPSWYAHVGAPSNVAPSGTPSDEALATSQELMKRQLAALLQQASHRQPIVIFLDDVHWADASTIDLLAYLATRFQAMRILFVVAYRPSELMLAQHPFLEVKRELEGRGRCREVAVPFLSRADVDEYLAHEFPGHRFPPAFAGRLHARTEGNALFLVDLVNWLRERGMITPDATLAAAAADAEHELPASIRSLIDKKIAQLDPSDHGLLAAASVQGYEFDSLVVSTALGADPAVIEERLAVLDRFALVRLVREEDDGDGHAPALRYRFLHVLYQDALYASLAPSRKAQLSGAIARALVACRGEGSEIASEVAHLYETAREFACATDSYARAAERAAELFAHAEAATLARRGLRTLARLPDTPERARKELRLQVTLGVALGITSGYAAADTGASITRAYELCRQTDDTPQLFPAVWRLWIYYAAGAESRSALALAQRLLRLAGRSRNRLHLAGAHFALGNTLHLLGGLEIGSEHLERAVALHDPRHVSAVLYGCDPGLYSRSHSARALWLLGYPERARVRSQETVALARAVGDPRSVAHAQMFAAICYQLRREPAEAQEYAEACVATGEAHGIADEPQRVAVVLGWAETVRGRPEDGVARIQRSVAALRVVRSINTLPYHLALLAEALGHAGRPHEGLAVVDDALEEVGRTGERFYEAELYRIRGELLVQSGNRRPDAERAFRHAIRIAHRQQAKSLELRAMVSLRRMWNAIEGGHEHRDALVRMYRGFTEGFDTVDLREARTLVDGLGTFDFARPDSNARRSLRHSPSARAKKDSR
jgi:DNA-binding winged helix-turn-helix (wHTH) protein/predicted ATPase